MTVKQGESVGPYTSGQSHLKKLKVKFLALATFLWRKCTKLNHVSCHEEGAVQPLASTVQAHHPKARYFSAHAAKPSVAFFSSQPPELHREPKTRRRRGEPMVLPMYFSNPRRTGCGQCNQPSNQHSQM